MTLYAHFNTIEFTVTVRANPDLTPKIADLKINGIDTKSASIRKGATITVNASPEDGWTLENWTIDGIEVATSRTHMLVVNADVDLVANFVQIFNITALVQEGSGTIEHIGTTQINQGGNRTYTITPSTGWEIDEVVIDGKINEGAITAGSYTFTNVVKDHSIIVYFKAR